MKIEKDFSFPLFNRSKNNLYLLHIVQTGTELRIYLLMNLNYDRVDQVYTVEPSPIQGTPPFRACKICPRKTSTWNYFITFLKRCLYSGERDTFLDFNLHRHTGNFLPGGAVNYLPKKFSQFAQIFTKE